MKKTIIIIFISALLVGCKSSIMPGESTLTSSTMPESTLVPMESVYPSGNNSAGNLVNGTDAYPAPINDNPQNLKLGPEFKIERPVVAGTVIIKGKGPNGIPIKLIDVSNMGEELANTIIDESGNFVFNLSSPLNKNTTIAIQLGDVSGTKIDPSDFVYSPNYIDKPMIGILFDMVIVD